MNTTTIHACSAGFLPTCGNDGARSHDYLDDLPADAGRDTILLDAGDMVAVATRPIRAGEQVRVDGHGVLDVIEDVPRGHKIALTDIPAGTDVVKYGFAIGHATIDIPRGSWVHTHNIATNLGPNLEYRYEPVDSTVKPGSPTTTFRGYRRRTGLVGIRNDLYIVPTVGCINGIAEHIARMFRARHGGAGNFDSVVVTTHPYGCSQLGGDLEWTQNLLRNIVQHPNAGGVLLVGLGCENNQMALMQAKLDNYDPDRVRFLICQDEDDELDAAADLLEELNEAAAGDKRVDVPISELRVAVECGGSDGMSGITANPMVGRFAEWLVSQGGTVVMSEVPEMFGAETVLMGQARDEEVFGDIVDLINNFKGFFRKYGEVISDNPSPGNKAGGITTLEDKSLGCIRKGGHCEVEDVLHYGERIRRNGFQLMQTPGNDLVSTTAKAAAGCNLILFTTGRGTPFGCFVPTVKIATNSALAAKKHRWIDFDAGRLLDESADDVDRDFRDLVLRVVNGEQASNERNAMQAIAIFKDGPTE
ncbi:UxaA family hydrolase [Bifidobacterium choloepi]|uniref:Altronate dehydratase n=1 Tax=Bifidobacterium choloepi TaxID=2614131 RepID=A0A6I5N058_9BIFI|nr:altronate dehydratase family protein [Bifidobacterium choloepi]NEG69495.1 altronate dehydratase [Bifidobacterium choloepi]